MDQVANASSTDHAVAWHATAVDEVVSWLATDGVKGLEPADAAALLQKYGPNRLPEGKRRLALALASQGAKDFDSALYEAVGSYLVLRVRLVEYNGMG